ncbi:Tetraspanin-5 [Nymphon striatum]|nr:Tetraspanin-5 [Nymphon striatum]
MPPRTYYRRDKTEISCCLKYLIFGFNIIFWLCGGAILAVGVWAWSEKDTINNLSRLTNIALDPAFVFIIVGTVTFSIGFTGCVGALRENTCLLAAYAIFLAIILLLEMTAGILGFIFKDMIKAQAAQLFRTFIVSYRDDADQQNLIDWVQEYWLECCGIEGPKDWDQNQYFNCSSVEVGSREACGVPFSCCKRRPNEVIKNKQCGYDVRKSEYRGDMSTVIFESGCVRAGEEWIEHNLVPVAGVAVGVAVLQSYNRAYIYNIGCLIAAQQWFERNLVSLAGGIVAITFTQILGICFAQNMRADIFAQKSKWH